MRRSFAGSFLQSLLEALRPIFFYGCDCSCVWRSWTWRAVPATSGHTERELLSTWCPRRRPAICIMCHNCGASFRSIDVASAAWLAGLACVLEPRTPVRANSAGRTRLVSVAHIGVSIPLPSRSASQSIISSSVIPGLCPSIANVVPIYAGA